MPENETPGITSFGAASREIGSARTGVDAMGFSNRDPLRDMQGARAATHYREMRFNDAIVGAIVMGVKMIGRSVEFQPQPPSDFAENDPEADRYKQFLKEAMDDMDCPWSAFVSDSFEAVIYGWEAMEWTLKQRLGPQPEGSEFPASNYDDGLNGWDSISHRDQVGLDHWEIDQKGDVQAMWHRTDTDPKPVRIPRWKFILFKTEHAGGHPEGYSWLRNAYTAYRYKKNLQWVEAVGAERGLVGLPKLTMPTGANTAVGSADMLRAEALVKGVRSDSYIGVILPPPLGPLPHQAWQFELASASGGRDGSTLDEIIRRHSSEMTTSILAHFINLGMQTTGAYALSRDQRDLWHIALSGLISLWAETMNKELVEPLFRYNEASFPDRTRWPKLVPTDIAQHDIEKLQAYITAMVTAGLLVPDGDDRNRVRDTIGWPPESAEVRAQIEADKAQADALAKQSLQQGAIATDAAAVTLDQQKKFPPAAQKAAPVKASEESEGATTAAEARIGKPMGEWDAHDWLVYMEDEPARQAGV